MYGGQGTLYPSNNLEHANPWLRLIKQKSVKIIGTSFVRYPSDKCAPYVEHQRAGETRSDHNTGDSMSYCLR